jgi:hypothetical protein
MVVVVSWANGLIQHINANPENAAAGELFGSTVSRIYFGLPRIVVRKQQGEDIVSQEGDQKGSSLTWLVSFRRLEQRLR